MSDISFRNVRKSYAKTEVIHGVNLDVRHGEFLVLLGPSGCGKSTLLRMLAGLEHISSGEISIAGTVVNKLEPRERGCAMVFQNYALYPHMSVAENIGYSLRVAGLAKPERQKRVATVAQSLALTDFLDRKPGQLSGGQRQRVAMGRAMIREPKVFLYDEPLSNLDARLRVAMRVEIRKLHQKLGTTTLFVTHDQVEAMTLADRIVVMNKGTIEQIGTPAEVYGTPASTYVAAFVGTPGLNLLNGVANPKQGIIILADGQELQYDKQRWPEVKSGAIVAGFRAEAMQSTTTGQTLTVSFAFNEELGASRLVHCTLANEAVVAAVSHGTIPADQQSLRFAVKPGDVQLFDAQTQRRLSDEYQRATNSQPQLVAAE